MRVRAGLRRQADRSRQRGSTLTGYALVVATLLTVSLVGIQSLNDNSEEFLGGTGSQIGERRQYSDQAAVAPIPPPPAWAQPTAPPTLRTYTNAKLSTGGGCIGWDTANSVFTTVPCGDPTAILISASSGDGTNIELSFSGGCFGGNPGSNPSVFVTACGSAPWTQDDAALPEVRYEYNGSGQCISFTTPANPGDPSLELVPCGNPSTNIGIV